MTLAERLGRNVKKLRTAGAMTQARLAEVADLTSDEVSRIERGAREPRFETIGRLAEALGVDAEVLFAKSPDDTSPVSRSAENDRLAKLVAGLSPAVSEAVVRLCRTLEAEQPSSGKRRRTR